MKHALTITVLTTYTGITLADVDLTIKIIVGLITVGYMVRKWYKMERQK